MGVTTRAPAPAAPVARRAFRAVRPDQRVGFFSAGGAPLRHWFSLRAPMTMAQTPLRHWCAIENRPMAQTHDGLLVASSRRPLRSLRSTGSSYSSS
jgi:hypothetical protein